MHVIFRESHGLEEADTPTDLGQSPADLVVLSFSDSDLGAFAAGWQRARQPPDTPPSSGRAGPFPTLRLANLVALRHPLSVDTYVEATLRHAKAIIIRLIGGESYWGYGVAEAHRVARKHGIALAVLPADGREDVTLDRYSTLPLETLRRLATFCDTGGAAAAEAALTELATAAGVISMPAVASTVAAIAECGWYDPERGVVSAPVPKLASTLPTAAVAFYRSYLTAADTAPIDALIRQLRARGFDAIGLFAPSLKSPGAGDWLRNALARLQPAFVINATAFSARDENERSPLDMTGCPVFQVALSTARHVDWAGSDRGLAPADLAMHVVLPEVDGRIFAGVASFKSPSPRDPDLQFSRFVHEPDPERIGAIVARAAGWHQLAATAAGDRRIALVLSTYPGKAHQMAHAVGLDALASTEAILDALAADGYHVTTDRDIARALGDAATGRSTLDWPLPDYLGALATLPPARREELFAAWGNPESDPAFRDGAFHFAAINRGHVLIALQPERGDDAHRHAEYHDLARTPRHAYVAFYLWLRAQALHALVHVGAHGTLEWLPGKSVALSGECWPEMLTGALPVVYPFIVNDPGEAAQAKRRIGAVTLGHLPPPLVQSAIPSNLHRLERLLDEYATADGLDPPRRKRLIGAIRDEARAAGVELDLGLAADASPAEAIARIDRFVCDIKDSQFGSGLHVYGSAPGEMAGLLSALSGRRVAGGPAGSPYRGRADVLPTGRNLYSVDPRAVPSRAAHTQGVKIAEELLRRHLQDHGEWPRGLIVDLWGSATMRTAGEEFAMALHLAGISPKWDAGSDRVAGFEIVPPALLGRPRIDVTLRVSGLFRDVFPGLVQLFEVAAAALARRNEPDDDNPYSRLTPRVFGPQPGRYGLGMSAAIVDDYGDDGRHAAGEAWLQSTQWAIGADGVCYPARAALEARVLAADGFAHVQDLVETDLLMAEDYAAHEGGFAAAVARLGGMVPALYHLDATRADAPRARALSEEIGRTVRARAANPEWATGMMAHGFRGAAEVAATLDNLALFAHLTRAVPAHLFDLYHQATLGRADLVAFMARENPGALAALRDRFARLRAAGLWATRHNAIAASLDESGAPDATLEDGR